MRLIWLRVESWRSATGFWMLIGWGSWRRSSDGHCGSGWGSHGSFAGGNRWSMRLSRFPSEASGNIPQRRPWCFCRRHWFWQIWSSKLRGFCVVDMDCPLQSIILVCHFILIRDTANTKGSLTPECQLGGPPVGGDGGGAHRLSCLHGMGWRRARLERRSSAGG